MMEWDCERDCAPSRAADRAELEKLRARLAEVERERDEARLAGATLRSILDEAAGRGFSDLLDAATQRAEAAERERDEWRAKVERTERLDASRRRYAESGWKRADALREQLRALREALKFYARPGTYCAEVARAALAVEGNSKLPTNSEGVWTFEEVCWAIDRCGSGHAKPDHRVPCDFKSLKQWLPKARAALGGKGGGA